MLLISLSIALQVLGCIVVADFLSGLVHWLEDTYGREDLPILGPLVILENNLHHQHPGYMTRFGWWKSSWGLCLLSLVLGLLAWALGLFTWHVAVVLLLGANLNQLHKWSHRPRRVNGPVITALQRWHILQSPAHHARHHGRGKRGGYCVLTPWLNPLFDHVRFWARIEQVVERVTDLQPRDPNTGPLPASYLAATVRLVPAPAESKRRP